MSSGKVQELTNTYIIRWTKQAIECYNRHCNCKGCDVKDLMESKCQMKNAVLKTFALIGAPPEPKDDKFDLEEIKQYLEDGFTLKEIAEKYGIKYWDLLNYTQAKGIKGYRYRGGEQAKRYRRGKNADKKRARNNRYDN